MKGERERRESEREGGRERWRAWERARGGERDRDIGRGRGREREREREREILWASRRAHVVVGALRARDGWKRGARNGAHARPSSRLSAARLGDAAASPTTHHTSIADVFSPSANSPCAHHHQPQQPLLWRRAHSLCNETAVDVAVHVDWVAHASVVVEKARHPRGGVVVLHRQHPARSRGKQHGGGSSHHRGGRASHADLGVRTPPPALHQLQLRRQCRGVLLNLHLTSRWK
jgi:hypothetical protein